MRVPTVLLKKGHLNSEFRLNNEKKLYLGLLTWHKDLIDCYDFKYLCQCFYHKSKYSP